jgi:hypothetical protein
MIGGFIVGPTDTGLTDVLVRDWAIAGRFRGRQSTARSASRIARLKRRHPAIAEAELGEIAKRVEIEGVGLAPNHDEEAALLETVAPGAYTAIVRGDGRTTGVGLVEVYNLPNTL